MKKKDITKNNEVEQNIVKVAPKTANTGLRVLLNWPFTAGAYEGAEHMKGGRGFTKEVAQEIINFFADNEIYDSQTGTKETTGEIRAYTLSKEFFTNYLGFFENANGGFSDSNPTVKSGAMAYIEDFKDIDNQVMTYRVNILYDCKFTEPSTEVVTNEDAIEYTEVVVPYSAMKTDKALDDAGNPVSYFWFIVPPGYSLSEVIEFLSVLPMPTDTLLPVIPLSEYTPTAICSV